MKENKWKHASVVRKSRTRSRLHLGLRGLRGGKIRGRNGNYFLEINLCNTHKTSSSHFESFNDNKGAEESTKVLTERNVAQRLCWFIFSFLPVKTPILGCFLSILPVDPSIWGGGYPKKNLDLQILQLKIVSSCNHSSDLSLSTEISCEKCPRFKVWKFQHMKLPKLGSIPSFLGENKMLSLWCILCVKEWKHVWKKRRDQASEGTGKIPSGPRNRLWQTTIQTSYNRKGFYINVRRQKKQRRNV